MFNKFNNLYFNAIHKKDIEVDRKIKAKSYSTEK